VVLATRKLIRSARDISDGGIAVALAQATFPKGIGATVEQEQSLMAHPLFGLFAEPASTVLVTTHPGNLSKIEELAGEYSFLAARIGTTGGERLEISVDGESFVSVPITDLRKPWASALEATLHGEVTA
jgi:phosphoribosylformylglycinamidine synthase